MFATKATVSNHGDNKNAIMDKKSSMPFQTD